MTVDTVKVLTVKDSERVLRQVSEDVHKSDNWQRLADVLSKTLREQDGAGLAAIQIGVPLRMFVATIRGQVHLFVNPVVLQTSERYTTEAEGCLSIPGKRIRVFRSDQIIVRTGQLRGMSPKNLALEGWDARVVQHEMDHLDGKLMTDRRG